MNTGMIPFEQVAQRAQQKAERRLQQSKIVELVRLIDELSGSMGVPAFREAVRQLGYDIDACHYTLMQRGVDRTN
jgi:hypothetical protein